MQEKHQLELSKINKNYIILKKFEEGMSNFTYLISDTSTDQKFVFHYPGDGANKIVNIKNEYLVYKMIKPLKITPNVTYFNTLNGMKITNYVDGESLTNSKYEIDKIDLLIKKVHLSNLKFPSYNHLSKLERFEKLHYNNIPNYQNLKNDFLIIFDKYLKQHIKSPCHNDFQMANIIKNDNDYSLIDWEFAAQNDPIYDIACFGNINFKSAISLLNTYFHNPSLEQLSRLYGWRMFQCLQWFNVASFKDQIGLSISLGKDFKAIAAHYLNLSKQMLGEITKLNIYSLDTNIPENLYRKTIVQSMNPVKVGKLGFEKAYNSFERSINNMPKEGDLAEELALKHLQDNKLIGSSFQVNKIISLNTIKIEADIIDYQNKIVYEIKSRKNKKPAKASARNKWKVFQYDSQGSRYENYTFKGIIFSKTNNQLVFEGILDFADEVLDHSLMKKEFDSYFKTLKFFKSLPKGVKVDEQEQAFNQIKKENLFTLEIEKLYKKRIEKPKQAIISLEIANFLYRQHQYQLSTVFYKEVFKFSTMQHQKLEAYIYIASSYLLLDNFSNANLYIKEGLKKNEDKPVLKILLAISYIQTNKKNLAIEILLNVFLVSNNPQIEHFNDLITIHLTQLQLNNI